MRLSAYKAPCEQCGRSYAVTRDGLVRAHRKAGRGSDPCLGGRLPVSGYRPDTPQDRGRWES